MCKRAAQTCVNLLFVGSSFIFTLTLTLILCSAGVSGVFGADPDSPVHLPDPNPPALQGCFRHSAGRFLILPTPSVVLSTCAELHPELPLRGRLPRYSTVVQQH